MASIIPPKVLNSKHNTNKPFKGVIRKMGKGHEKGLAELKKVGDQLVAGPKHQVLDPLHKGKR